MKKRPWTEQELQQLQELYEANTAKEVARITGRSVTAIRNRAFRLKHQASSKEPANRPWTPQEEKLLKTMYQTASVEEISQLIGRTVAAVRSRAGEMKLKKGFHLARHVKPIGSERMDRGIRIRKVTNTGRPKKDWKRVDVIAWEAVHGPIPPGYTLMRKDSSLPRTLDNLALFTKVQHLERATVHRFPPEIVDLYQLKAQITKQIERLSREAQSPKSEST